MTIRFASGGSHFVFLLVDLTGFMQAFTFRLSSNQNRNFAKLISGSAVLHGVSFRSALIASIKESLLGELSDAGNLDQGG
jgi:hypothetical protein